MDRINSPVVDDRADGWLDCVVVGGGPAGSLAMLHLVRSGRRALLIDAGRSRTRYISTTHNCPGFPHGVSGPELMQRLWAQLRTHAAPVALGVVECITAIDNGYEVHSGQTLHRARCVIVATGVVDRLPSWVGVEQAILDGIVRLCPICDAYEARGKRIAIYGEASDCISHAAFLRTHSIEVTALHRHGDECSPADLELAKTMEIEVAPADDADCRIEDGALAVRFSDGSCRRFDVVYVALGADSRSDILAMVGARRAEQGDIVIDAQCETSCPGIFAIGDVVSGLNQIAVAFGHAAIAASAVHRRLPHNPMNVEDARGSMHVSAMNDLDER